jgi:hypothetical protein
MLPFGSQRTRPVSPDPLLQCSARATAYGVVAQKSEMSSFPHHLTASSVCGRADGVGVQLARERKLPIACLSTTLYARTDPSIARNQFATYQRHHRARRAIVQADTFETFSN